MIAQLTTQIWNVDLEKKASLLFLGEQFCFILSDLKLNPKF